MKRVLLIVMAIAALLSLAVLTGCGGQATANPDYQNAEEFEAALNAGDDPTGKSVKFEVKKLVPNSAFGYNMQAGKHLNFCSDSNPNAKEGDSVTVKVTGIKNTLGSWIISYQKL